MNLTYCGPGWWELTTPGGFLVGVFVVQEDALEAADQYRARLAAVVEDAKSRGATPLPFPCHVGEPCSCVRMRSVVADGVARVSAVPRQDELLARR